MDGKYVLLVIKPSNPKIPEVMNTGTNYCTAVEGNQDLLLFMGKDLKEKGYILSYQLARIEGDIL
jgi:hypothetical protein